MSKTITLHNGCGIRLAEENGYAQFMRDVVEKELAACRTEAEIPLSGGGTLHAENYVLPGAERSIILLHGYTESAEKLREMAWYFRQAGYSVFSYDQRGHGRSLRLVEDVSITHVEHFQDYVNDLEEFILQAVRPVMKDAPIDLYAHSMGGAVGAHFLIRHPDTVRRALLTAPMIAPSANPFPLWMGKLMSGSLNLIGKGKERAFIAGPFDPEKETFETSFATGRERFDYYRIKRRDNACLQNCSPTYRWVYEAADQTKILLNAKKAGTIRTRVLLCQAARDTVVLLPQQNKFVSLLRDGALISVDAKHEIYLSEDRVMHAYVADVLNFLTDD